MHEAFVYSWRNKTTGRLYIGFHKGSENDGYICSSSVMLEEYTKNPDNFERFLIAHGTVTDMLALETAILKAVDAKSNSQFYNQHNGNGLYFCKSHTQASRKKISLAQIGKKHSAESRKKMSDRARSRDNSVYSGCQKGIPKSPEHVAALRAARKPISEETRSKMRAVKQGKKRPSHSPETIAKMRAAYLRRFQLSLGVG